MMSSHASSRQLSSLRAFVERSLQESAGIAPHDVRRIDVRPSRYRTSFPLDEVRVLLADGRRLRLLRKNLSLATLRPDATAAKPAHLHDPHREIDVYRRVLSAELGTPRLFGVDIDEGAERYWLLIEHVRGRELYQVGDLEPWCAAAAWFGRFHAECRWVPASPVAAEVHLLVHGRELWEGWIRRAVERARGDADPRTGDFLQAIGRADQRVLEVLDSLPPRFIHGDAYASNVLVAGDAPLRVCAVDWESAAVGPALLDIAALTAGWDDGSATHIAQAYRDASHEWSGPGSRDDFWTALDACRVLVAVQWLGWAPGWLPPPENRTDWGAAGLAALSRLA
jgi:aminoglycoside phosphotransferase (APT) family kinase protein